MSAYLLTHSETLTLCTLLHLPVQPGSVLSAWLRQQEFPESIDLSGESLESLAGKGYYAPQDKNQPIQPELVKSLVLFAVNAAEIIAILRRNGQAALTRFAQMGNSVVQYGIENECLCVHAATVQAVLVDKIIPGWFTVSQNEGLKAELPLGAFLLFKRACELADLTTAETNFASAQFAKRKLLEQSRLTDGGINLFNVAEVSRGSVPDQMSLQDQYRLLVSQGFLMENPAPADTIEIAPAGKALAGTLSDPDLCSLIVSLQIWDDDLPKTGAFLHGDGRLFFLDASQKPGIFLIRQLANRHEGCSWMQDLLAEGSSARYADYVITPLK